MESNHSIWFIASDHFGKESFLIGPDEIMSATKTALCIMIGPDESVDCHVLLVEFTDEVDISRD
jgi:hypothetical protein